MCPLPPVTSALMGTSGYHASRAACGSWGRYVGPLVPVIVVDPLQVFDAP